MPAQNIEIRDEDISNLLNKVEQHLNDQEKAIFVTLVEVAKSNIYLVKRLTRDLKRAQARLKEVYNISNNISLTEIAEAFANPSLNSFSEQDAISAIDNMKRELQTAANYQQALKTILSVAKIFAPILLV